MGMIDKFMGGIMNWAVKKTSSKVDKMIKNDDELGELKGQFKKDAADLRKHLEK